MQNITIVTGLVQRFLVVDGAQNVAECHVCVFRCHQCRVEPLIGGQQLVHRPAPYAHRILNLLLHGNPLIFLSGSTHSNNCLSG